MSKVCPICDTPSLEMSYHWVDREPFMACRECNSTFVMKNEIKAECTVGDGPDVLIDLNQFPITLLDKVVAVDKFVYGMCYSSQIDLTISEARKLAEQLNKAADIAEEFYVLAKRS